MDFGFYEKNIEKIRKLDPLKDSKVQLLAFSPVLDFENRRIQIQAGDVSGDEMNKMVNRFFQIYPPQHYGFNYYYYEMISSQYPELNDETINAYLPELIRMIIGECSNAVLKDDMLNDELQIKFTEYCINLLLFLENGPIEQYKPLLSELKKYLGNKLGNEVSVEIR